MCLYFIFNLVMSADCCRQMFTTVLSKFTSSFLLVTHFARHMISSPLTLLISSTRTEKFILFIALNCCFSFTGGACVTSFFFEVSTTVVLFNSGWVQDALLFHCRSPARGQVCGSQPEAVSKCLPVWDQPHVNVWLSKILCPMCL